MRHLRDLFRMSFWLIACFVLLVALGRPQEVPVVAYKLALITGAASLGYWIDRTLFPYARPHAFLRAGQTLLAAAMLRRAVVMAAVILGVALAL